MNSGHGLESFMSDAVTGFIGATLMITFLLLIAAIGSLCEVAVRCVFPIACRAGIVPCAAAAHRRPALRRAARRAAGRARPPGSGATEPAAPAGSTESRKPDRPSMRGP